MIIEFENEYLKELYEEGKAKSKKFRFQPSVIKQYKNTIDKLRVANITPFEATHPGTLLLDEIRVRNIKQKELASELGVLPTFLNEIIKGKRAITADFAILLEKALEIPADFWMRFQTQYDIDKAKLKEKNIRKIELIETWNIIKKYVPIKQFKKLGYLTDSLENNIQEIKEIYKVTTIDDLVNVVAKHRPSSFYRKSEKLQIDKTLK